LDFFYYSNSLWFFEEISIEFNLSSFVMKKINIIFCTIFFSTPAYAYLDPGLGSILIQSLIAFIAVIITTASIYLQKIKSFFSRFKKNKKKESYISENDGK